MGILEMLARTHGIAGLRQLAQGGPKSSEVA
jgi:hypothetical protein